MEFDEKMELNLLQRRRDFCVKAMSTYNKKLPNKLLIAFGIGLLYSSIRIKINSEERISFFTTLILILLFFNAVVLVEHVRLLYRIKKDIKEVDDQIKNLKAKI